MGKRAVTANGDKIREHRVSKGWTRAELADACHLDVRTIRTAELNKGVDVSSLNSIADSLDIEVSEIIAAKQMRRRVTFVTTMEFENVKEEDIDIFINIIESHFPKSNSDDEPTQSFREIFKSRFASCGEIVFLAKSKGSTLITLEMDDEDIEYILIKFRTYQRRLANPDDPLVSTGQGVGTIVHLDPEQPANERPSIGDFSIIEEIRVHPKEEQDDSL